MWVYPSYGRAEKCAAVLAAMAEHGSVEPGLVYTSQDDPQLDAYLALTLPPNWELVIMPVGNCWLTDKLNNALCARPDEPWYGFTSDDMVIKTKGFEQELIAAAGSYGIASANDLWQSDADITRSRMQGVIVFGGDFLRALGYWVPAGLRHQFTDDVWESLGRGLRNWRVLMNVVTEHDHPFRTGAKLDDTYAHSYANAVVEADTAAYAQWRNGGEYDAAVARCRKAKLAPLLAAAAGRSLMICTPTYDGLIARYVSSLLDTTSLLQAHGIKYRPTFNVGNSLLPMARNQLVAEFLESDFTDLLFIDADMIWDCDDVLKLLASPQGIVAAVGKRKKFRDDEDLDAWCVGFDGTDIAEDGFGGFEASMVGTAFMRVRRSVFEEMAAAHPELERKLGRPGSPVDEGTYFRFFAIEDHEGCEISEDFAFCRRWRQMGGSVWIDPSIRLGHQGNHVFDGDIRVLFAA